MKYELPPGLIVSVSGVRGRVGESLTPDVIARFAAAFGAYARTAAEAASGSTGPSFTESRPSVIVARDARTSGPLLERIVMGSLQAVGCDVIRLGLTPTPTALMAVRHHEAAGGIVVTASHNPVEWNALKLASGSGMFLDAEEGERMRAYLDDRPIPYAAWDGLGTVTRDGDAVDRHLTAVLSIPYLDIDGLRDRGFTVALDCVRGAGAVLLPRLLDSVGCEVIGLDLEPDGRFTREPEPVPKNLAGLGDLVRDSGADFGLATDPDADRVALVDGDGRAIGEDYTLAFAAWLVLRHRKGPVVTNLSTSRLLDDVAAEAGVPLARAPVGEINVVRRMQAEDAVIGGEGNGGVILPEANPTRDSAVAAALVLQLLLESGRSLAELVAARPSYEIVKAKVPRTRDSLEPVYSALETRLGAPETDRQDGLRLAWPEDGRWLHVRPSGTEPILRIIAEAPTGEAAEELVAGARDVLETARSA